MERQLIYLVCILAIAIPVMAADYYVAEDGSNSNDGSFNSPLATIAYALDNANPGDTVYVRGGTYTEVEIWYNTDGGEEGAYITLEGYPGETAILTGGRLVIESKYMKIKNLHFDDYGFGVRRWEGRGYQQSHHIEISGNRFSTDDVAIFFMCDNGLVEDNIFDLSYYAVYLMQGDGNVIRNNIIHTTIQYSIHVYDEDKYQYAGVEDPLISNLLIEGNIINGSQTRAGIVISAGESTSKGIDIDGVIVRNNVTTNHDIAGIAVYYYGSVRDVNLLNNAIYNSNTGIDIGADDADDISIINNILSSNTQHMDITGITDLVVDNNLFFQPDSTNFDSDPVFGDPLFYDPENLDLHVYNESPVCGAGEPSISPDIGAYPCGDYAGPYCGDGLCNGNETCESCADCGECDVEYVHDAEDEPCDGCVDVVELAGYVHEWKLGNVQINEFIEAIGIWKGGCG